VLPCASLPLFSIRVRGIISVTWFPRGVTSQVENPFESHPPSKNLSIRFRIDNEALLLSHTVHPSNTTARVRHAIVRLERVSPIQPTGCLVLLPSCSVARVRQGDQVRRRRPRRDASWGRHAGRRGAGTITFVSDPSLTTRFLDAPPSGNWGDEKDVARPNMSAAVRFVLVSLTHPPSSPPPPLAL
jgi:hypothetical protein